MLRAAQRRLKCTARLSSSAPAVAIEDRGSLRIGIYLKAGHVALGRSAGLARKWAFLALTAHRLQRQASSRALRRGCVGIFHQSRMLSEPLVALWRVILSQMAWRQASGSRVEDQCWPSAAVQASLGSLAAIGRMRHPGLFRPKGRRTVRNGEADGWAEADHPLLSTRALGRGKPSPGRLPC